MPSLASAKLYALSAVNLLVTGNDLLEVLEKLGTALGLAP